MFGPFFDSIGSEHARAGAALYLCFGVSGEALALRAATVAEVARLPAWTRVPGGRASLLGVANLRGTVLPVLSLAALLGRAAAAPTPAARLLVLAGGAPVGLLVDHVTRLGPAGDARPIDARALLDRDFARPSPAVQPAGAGPAGPQPAARAPGIAEAAALAVVLLRAGGQHFALALGSVIQILRVPASIARVQGADAAMLGVIPQGGQALPLVSLAALAGLAAGVPAGGAARVVVISVCGAPLGLAVDAVTATLAVPCAAIDPLPPVLIRGAGETMLDGICRLDGGTRLVGLLAAGRLLGADTLARLLAAVPDAPPAAPAASPDEPSRAEASQFIVFRLGDAQFGLPIASVDEVVRRPAALTAVPNAPDFLTGLMNLRGRGVPVIDLTRRLGLAGPVGQGGRVVVISADGVQAGLSVDGVPELWRVPAAGLHPAAATDALFDRVALRAEGGLVPLLLPRAVLAQTSKQAVLF